MGFIAHLKISCTSTKIIILTKKYTQFYFTYYIYYYDQLLIYYKLYINKQLLFKLKLNTLNVAKIEKGVGLAVSFQFVKRFPQS